MSDTYDIVFEVEGPMGISLESSYDGLGAFVTSSNHPEIGENHSLVAVNGTALDGLSFEDILENVQSATWPRTLSFTAVERSLDSDSSLPLPDSFFDYLADLTNQEEDMIKEFMTSQLDVALDFVTSDPESNGLSLATESDNVKVYLGRKIDAEGEELQLVMSKVEIPIPSDLLMNAAVTSVRGDFKRIFTMLDPMFGDGDVLHVIPSNYDRYGRKTVRTENLCLPLYSVKWGAWILPFPFSSRDFVFCELTCWAKNGMGVSMCISIPKISSRVKNLEESHNFVRGNMGMTGYFWQNKPGSDPKKPLGANSMCINLTYILQINLNGSIPRWVVDLVGPMQGLNVKRVRDYAMKQRELATLFFDDNTELNAFETLEKCIEKGTCFEVSIYAEAGLKIVYEWTLEDHDICFSIIGPDEEVLLPSASHSCSLKNKNPFQKRLSIAKTGLYRLVFDNTGSWFTNKTVYYHYIVIDPNDPIPWIKWCTIKEAMAADE